MFDKNMLSIGLSEKILYEVKIAPNFQINRNTVDYRQI